jgi:hypothetical protein
MPDGLRENFASLLKIIAGVQEPVDFRAILGPLLDLVVIAVVREGPIVGFFVGPIVHRVRSGEASLHQAFHAFKRRHKAKRHANFQQVFLAFGGLRNLSRFQTWPNGLNHITQANQYLQKVRCVLVLPVGFCRIRQLN